MDTCATIAVVDDDLSVRRALGRLLRSFGLSVELYPSAEAYLDERDRLSVALLIVDVVMAEMGGLDLLESLAATGSPPSAVVITAHETEVTRERARRCGVPILRKPIESAELVAVVERALGRTLQRLDD